MPSESTACFAKNARRRRHRQDRQFAMAYKRHRWRSEGVHAESKLRHGLPRAVRRGLANVAIQAYLTAAIINLERLARVLTRIGFERGLPKTIRVDNSSEF